MTMTPHRPDPDELLAHVKAEEAAQVRGKLKIFFGATAGVGKTYAMLQAAHERQGEGVEVLVGWVDTHGRAETEVLLAGLPLLPPRLIPYKGATLREFDLDAALQRRPALLVVDELAHTNAAGSRHAKRWQDVEELLQAGINVYTAVNVQHLASLNDVVAQVTGVIVRETIPDAILEEADEVELIDLPPDELLQRLREGKVYVAPQAERAVQNFFRKGNLIALRELALRRTAERVDEQMQAYRRAHAIQGVWPTVERLLVCVSPSPLAPRLVRATKRMATGLHAAWIVAYVETASHLRLPESERDRVIQTLRLAEELGAEVVTLSGENVGEEILTYAQARNVTKLVVGKPTHPRWRDVLYGSMLDDLVRRSGEIDVYVISGDPEEGGVWVPRLFQRTSDWSAYGKGVLVVALCTLMARGMFPFFAEANLIMVYLLGVVYVATHYGRGPSLLASVLSVAAFDFFYVHPYLTFAVSDTQYLVTFGVMLVVALVISSLTVQLRQQAEAARERERRTASLYAMSHEFASRRGLDNLLQTAVRHISEVFDGRAAVLLPDEGRQLGMGAQAPSDFELEQSEQGVAQWVYEHAQPAGLGTATLPGAQALYLPLIGTQGTVGVLGVRPQVPRQLLTPEQLHLLETFANQSALAIERAHLADAAQQARIETETERLRSSLLSSVSHDLRTPLASITGAASSLVENRELLDPAIQRDLTQTIYEEATRLNRLVGNLLDMTRLESGGIEVQKEWQPLEEVVGAALTRLEMLLGERPIEVHIPPDLPLIAFDGILIEQLLVNLLENAARYTPAGSAILITATSAREQVRVEVADEGAGLAAGDEERVFEKFYRGPLATQRGGVGLGLAICQAIVQAHGGRIWAENRTSGGARFSFTLPLTGQAPTIQMEGTELRDHHARV